MFKNILVAIDGSAASQRAFPKALELAKALNAELTLVHALDVFDTASPDRPVMPLNSYSVSLDKAMQEAYMKQWTQFVEHYEALLQQRQKEAADFGVSAHYLQPYGRPGPAICKTAENKKIDLIVVGTRGHNGFKELFLGSVSNYIMHHAPCSVTIIHPQDHHSENQFKQEATKEHSVVTAG